MDWCAPELVDLPLSVLGRDSMSQPSECVSLPGSGKGFFKSPKLELASRNQEYD
jgi:hypothetical protein